MNRKDFYTMGIALALLMAMLLFLLLLKNYLQTGAPIAVTSATGVAFGSRASTTVVVEVAVVVKNLPFWAWHWVQNDVCDVEKKLLHLSQLPVCGSEMQYSTALQVVTGFAKPP